MARGLDQPSALGTEPVGRLLWHACSQTTFAVGVYGIYSLTNAFFVSKGVGADALAAVNLASPLLLILGAMATTVGVGGASVISRRLGTGDTDGAARAAGQSFIVFWLSAIAVTGIGLAGLNPLLRLLGANDQTIGYAHDYAVVLLLGSITATGFSALVRAEGRMRYATCMWLIPVLVQIILDPLFIFCLHWGVAGAALGTVGGQAVSAGMSLWFFFAQPHRIYRIGWAQLRPHPATIRAIIAIGAPSFLAGLGATILVAAVNNRLAVLGGATALAAFAIASRIQTFVVMPQTGICQGLQPLAGYNTGAGKWPRVLRARNLTLRATIVYGILAFVVMVLFATPLVDLFTDDDAVRADGVAALRLIAVGFVFSGITPLVSAYFQSIGQARPSYWLSVGTLIAIKIPLVWWLSRYGLAGVWVSLALGEVLAACLALIMLARLGARPAGDLGVRASPPGSERSRMHRSGWRRR